MSLGGFVLASMAILASIKDSTEKTEPGDKPKTGRQFLFNSKAYGLLIKSFSWACLVYGLAFLYFSVLRTLADSLETESLFNLTFFGLFFSLFTLLRCIYLIQAVVRIK